MEKKYGDLIQAFKTTWDFFPGAVRLIDKGNVTIAVNRFASEHGMEAGQICAKMGAPESHRGCLKNAALVEQEGKIDSPTTDKIRGWLPIEGYPEVVVHFSLSLPDAK
ncbi:MAG: hypothetical protein ACOX1S_15325 [Anaerostipes sp.]|jgi:hypothetical protein|uniref:Uncharacterized protein n=1 Tax=Blautia producta TaxID=33035 RepID=A0A4P6LRZ8_9FIRM|nr:MULTISPECIES: hypothetical protein [Blautia]MDT4377073.1 hypothetical protein [Blautia coccoides]QBE94931.1 hypothetical protein PMF13cell1_00424 [Blautia producta]